MDFPARRRESVPDDDPLIVDCYMSLTPTYATELAEACKHLNINWWEEILQPDVMWVGGLTELLRIAAHASVYDIPIIPHGSGPENGRLALSGVRVAWRPTGHDRTSASCGPAMPLARGSGSALPTSLCHGTLR